MDCHERGAGGGEKHQRKGRTGVLDRSVIPIIARKTTLVVLNNVVGALLGFISLSIIARHLGAEDLGVLGFGISFLGMFTFVSNLGFDSSHNKRVSEGLDLGECMGAYTGIKVILTAVMACTGLLIIHLYKWSSGGFSSPKAETVVYIFLGYYVLWSLAWIPITTFNSERKQARAQLPGIIEFLVRTPLIVVVVLQGYGIVWVAVSYVVGAMALFLTGMVFLRGYPIRRPDLTILAKYADFALPMSIISIAAVLYLYMDKVMIGLFWDPEEVGFYFGAQRIIMFIITSSAAVSILLFPTISSLHADGRIREINDLITQAERFLSMIVFPVIALTIALRGPIVDLILGDGFLRTRIILVFLALYALLEILNKPYSQILTGTGNTRAAVRISSAIFFLNLFLNLIFIPETLLGVTLAGLGGLGAAMATCLSDTIRFVLLRIKAKGLIGSTFRPGIMVKHMGASAGAGGVMYGISLIIGRDLGMMLLIPFLMIGLLLYLAILILLREFTREDLDFFLDMLHPGKIGRYIMSEIR